MQFSTVVQYEQDKVTVTMRLQEIIGIAVFDIKHGKQVGRVQDVLFNRDWTIEAIQLSKKGFFRSYYRLVSSNHIVTYGEDAIMVHNNVLLRRSKLGDTTLTYALGTHKLKDLPVLTEQGLQLGQICDLYMNGTRANKITGIELSDGFVSDLIEGRKWLACTAHMYIGQNAIIVPSLSERYMKRVVYSING